MRWSIARHLRMIAIWLLLLPFVGTSLVAKGVMPTLGSNGVIILVICSGGTMVEMAFDAETMEPLADAEGEAPPEDVSGFCVWAALHPSGYPPESWPVALGDIGLAARVVFPRSTVLQIAAATGLPPATGPPVSI